MARELKANLDKLLASNRGLPYASWLILTLPKLQGSPGTEISGRTYYLATRALTINNHPYEVYLKELGDIGRDVDRTNETTTAQIENLSTLFGNVLLNDVNLLLGATVTAGRWWLDPDSGQEVDEQLFSGIVDDAQGTQREVTLFLLSDIYAAQSIGGGRAAERDCQHIYNSPLVRASGTGLGDACGYTGGLPTCNKLHADTNGCSGHSNTHRYGGMVKSKSGSAPGLVQLTQKAKNYQIGYSVAEDSTATPVALQPFIAAFELHGLALRNNALEQRSEIYTKSVPTRWRNLVTDFNGFESVDLTTTSITNGSDACTLAAAIGFQPGHGILIAGAGVSGADLITTVLTIDGTFVTLADAASTTVSGARVQHDNSDAIQAAVDTYEYVSLYIPRGNYLFARRIILADPALPEGITEGKPLVIKGAGKGVTKLLYQGTDSAFVGYAGEDINNIQFEDFTLSSTQPGSPFSGNFSNSKGWAFDLSESNVVNRLRMENMIINSWGRGAFVGANVQNAVFDSLDIRLYNTCGIALVGPETIFISGGESNATTIRDCLIELGQYINDDDIALTNLTYNNGSKTVTAASAVFSASHVGRFIRLYGAGLTGGDVIAVIKTFVSTTQVTISHANISGSNVTAGTGIIYKTNISAIWFQRASNTSINETCVQGNWSNADGTHNTSGVILENSDAVTIRQLWVEDTGGAYGQGVNLINCNATRIDGYHSNADGGTLPNCHGGDVGLTNSQCYVTNLYNPGAITHFILYDDDSEVFVDNSRLGHCGFYRPEQDNVVFGDNVKFQVMQGFNEGTHTWRDGTYGEQWLLNPRGEYGTNNLGDWTITTAAGISVVGSGVEHYDRYFLVNTQGMSDGSRVGIFSQTRTIPDSYPTGPFVLGFDWYVEDFGSPTTGEVILDVVGANGAEAPSGNIWKIQASNSTATPEDTWLRGQMSLYLDSGTSRSFQIRIEATQGPKTPRVRFANFRLMPGRHAAWSHDEPITTQRGGLIPNSVTLTGTDQAGIILVPKGTSGVYNSFFRFTGEGLGNWQGGVIHYDADNNQIYFSVHDANDQNTANDILAMRLTRSNGRMSLITEKTVTTARAFVGGRLKIVTSAVGNVGTGEDDLITYTVPALVLSATNEALEIECFGTFAANANNKTIKAYYGGTQIFTTGAVAFNGGSWLLRVIIIRTGTTAAIAIARFSAADATAEIAPVYTSLSPTHSNTNIFKLTGEATATDDISQKAMLMNWFPTGS